MESNKKSVFKFLTKFKFLIAHFCKSNLNGFKQVLSQKLKRMFWLIKI